METTSILSQSFINGILETARQNLERNGNLLSVIFLKFDDNQVCAVGINMPETPEERRVAVHAIRQKMGTQGLIQEAVMIMNTWYVAGKDASGGLPMMPSQHPQRQEAIIIVGRNADNNRSSTVLQPYSHNQTGGLRWHKLAIAQYNQPSDEAIQVMGLLDDLFIAQSVQ